MTTHLYCILPRAARVPLPPGLVGIGDAPVRALATNDIVAWVSDAAVSRSASVEGIQAHNAVVEAALESGATPAPVRFGQRFADDVACEAALQRVAPSIEVVLDDVQGSVEMTLILTPSTKQMLRDLQPVPVPTGSEHDPGSGRRYLEALRAREAAAGAVWRAMDALAQRLSDAVRRFVRRTADHEQFTRMPLRTISHLVAKELVGQYRDALQAVTAGTEFRFLVVGPRPPYSFCAIGADGADSGRHGIKLAD
jgi:hypothetical protein